MEDLRIIDEHIIIRETIGYEGIANIEVHDLPQVIEFLKVVYNYVKMQNILNINIL